MAIEYQNGVICYDNIPKDEMVFFFSSYIRKSFPKHFQASANSKAIRSLQDGDPSQNSAVAQKAMSDVDTLLFRIPTCSPDLNPIENILKCACKVGERRFT